MKPIWAPKLAFRDFNATAFTVPDALQITKYELTSVRLFDQEVAAASHPFLIRHPQLNAHHCGNVFPQPAVELKCCPIHSANGPGSSSSSAKQSVVLTQAVEACYRWIAPAHLTIFGLLAMIALACSSRSMERILSG